MHFLVIDIEACNMYLKGSVFSIGVVCADADFNILYKKDILINPLCKFATKFRKPINFSVNHDMVKNCPTFAEIYPTIKELFCGNNLVVAHSANNDMYMLNAACKRARVAPLSFDYICTQTIYSAVYEELNGIGLNAVAEKLELSFTHHKADDDAEMALHLLKACCEHMDCTYKQLETKLGITKGRVSNYDHTPMHSKRLDALRRAKRLEYASKQKRLSKELKHYPSTIKMGVDARYFDLIKLGIKCIELRLNDDKRRLIEVGDVVFFEKKNGKTEFFKAKVTEIIKSDSFVDLLQQIDKVDAGMRNKSDSEALEMMYSIYSREKESEWGVVAIKFEEII